MSVPFTIFEKHNIQKPTAPKRFYAQAKSRGAIEIREIGCHTFRKIYRKYGRCGGGA